MTNNVEPMNTFPRLEENPAAKDIYPGTSGRTQGDIKEIKPAIKAIGIATIK